MKMISLKEMLLDLCKTHDLDFDKVNIVLGKLYEHGYIKKSTKPPVKAVDFDINEYRQFFSAKYLGIPGRMGDPKACEIKMKAFLTETGYDYSLVLAATKKYIESLEDPVFCKHADNFISHSNTGKEIDRKSMLATYIDDLLNNETISNYEAI